MTNEEIDKLAKEWDSFMVRMYLLGYTKFRRALRLQIGPILLALENTQNIAFVQGMTNTLITELSIQAAMSEFLPMVADRTAKKIAKQYVQFMPKGTSVSVGFGNEIFRERMTEYIRTIGYDKHAKDITETTKKLVRQALQDGLDNRDTMRQVAKRINDYTQIGKSRALMIAKTESSMCSAVAKDLQVDAYPYLFEVVWVPDHPKEHRQWHLNLANKKVDKGDTFKVVSPEGTTLMKYPHDVNGGAINNINCRCTAVYKPKEDKEGNLYKK